MLATSAVLAVLVYGNLGDRSAVLAVAAEIRPGQVIEENDLRVVRVAADPGVATMAASRAAREWVVEPPSVCSRAHGPVIHSPDVRKPGTPGLLA